MESAQTAAVLETKRLMVASFALILSFAERDISAENRTRPCQLSPRRRVYQVTEEIHAESRTSGRRDSVCACRFFDLRREPGGADGCGGSRGSKATRRRERTGRPPG